MALTTSACFDFDYDIMPLGIFISIRKNFRPKGNVAAHTAILQESTLKEYCKVASINTSRLEALLVFTDCL